MTNYNYQLWNGKQIIGIIRLKEPIRGKALVLSFFGPYETITLPLFYLSEDDGVRVLTCRVLDVRKKSKRQIERLKTWNEPTLNRTDQETEHARWAEQRYKDQYE